MKFCLVISQDEHYVVGVGVEADKEHVRVYHLKKGVFLHKIALKYPNFKEIKTIVSFHLCYIALIDNDKANIINCTEKKFSRSIKHWSGQMTRDQNYGLGAPAKGGLYLVNLNTGNTCATYIEPCQEGVFKRDAGRGDVLV